MSRFGGQVRALDLFNLAGTTDPWKSLLTIDDTPPHPSETYAPRTLRLWATRGFQGAVKGFRARIMFGVGDVSQEFLLGVDSAEMMVPTHGLALPCPAGNVRVDVAWTAGLALLPPSEQALVRGTITRGAPVLTWVPGNIGLTDPGVAAAVSLDPEDYNFASLLKVTTIGLAGATIQMGAPGPVNPLPPGVTVEFPFTATATLTSNANSTIWYSIGFIS